MKLDTEKFSVVIYARKNGCKSTTVGGVIRWLKNHPQIPIDTLVLKDGCGKLNKSTRGETRSGLPYHVGDASPVSKYRGWIGVAIPDPKLSEIAESKSRAESRRAKNFNFPKPVKYGLNFATHITTDRSTYRGRYNGWEHTDRTPSYQSGLWMSRSGSVVILGQQNKITHHHFAPFGLKFKKDDLGIKVISADGTDYHPTLEEWRSSRFSGLMREKLTEKRSKLRTQAAQDRAQAELEKIFHRDLSTTRVTLDDSRSSGNCVEGSLAFAERRLGMSRSEILDGRWLVSVPASRLIATQDPRALQAARAAWSRETMVSI